MRIAHFLTILLIFSNTILDSKEFIWGSHGKPFTYAQKTDLSVKVLGRGDDSLQVNRKSYIFDENNWFESIYLPFEESSRNKYLQSDLKNPYVILKSSYRSRQYKDSIQNAASFESPDHQIWLTPPRYLFLSKTSFIGDFSILFLVKPHTHNKNMQIFYKTSFLKGRKYGLSCVIRDGRVVFQFHNLFWLEDSSIPFLEIQSRESLSTFRFHKVMLQYKESESRLGLFLDSVEQEVRYITKTGKPGDTQYLARFHSWDQAPLIIGKNFTGALDEMIFSNQLIPVENNVASYGPTQKVGPRFHQKAGLLLSEVDHMPYSQSAITELSYLAHEPKGSSIRLHIRFSDQPFPPDTSEFRLPFKKIDPQIQDISHYLKRERLNFSKYEIKIKDSFKRFYENKIGRGKYFQWKAVFYPDPLGKYTPILDEVRVNFQENPPPSAPQNLEIVSVDESRVILRFSRNSELDVLQGGRYHIYYGVRPDQALGVIRYKKITPSEKLLISDKDHFLTEDLRYQNRIQVSVNNEMIYQNLVYTKSDPHLNYEYPFLQKNVAYYFWVTACDNSYNERIEYFDHESKPSNHVIARIQ